ncbi:hypothetical protein D9757_003876 [Collybiopsis confluens]|uniref:Nephrocystin 3-like N-terminal domain-containing protein n=1 Tax=Collybiopsis confluens TaxID=2823264 RepID=A0A8H5HVM6_9AGAR|nr:hypothetical protein D9757_003876 [Collybiopsis confluens]
MSSVTAFAGARNVTITGGQINNIGRDQNIINNYLSPPAENVHESIKAKLFRKLNPITNAHIRTEKICLEKTRVDIIREISQWILQVDEASPQVCILYGGAGTGKSAICHTIGKKVNDSGELGAFFCFDRTFAAERTPAKALYTIAYDLGWKSLDFGKALVETVDQEQYLCNSSDIYELWEKLILVPAQKVTQAKPMVIIIDALDEIGKETQESKEKLLSLFLNENSKLPKNMHILVTSRSENDINEYIDQYGLALWTQDMSELGKTEEDIGEYVYHRMKSKLSPSECKILAKQAEGYFQWAYTACQALLQMQKPGIKFKSQYKQFLTLSPSQNRHLLPLDALYRSILASIFDSRDETVMEEYRKIMSQIFSAYQPLSRQSLIQLQLASQQLMVNSDSAKLDFTNKELEVEEEEVVLQYLGSLFRGVEDMTTPVQPVHISVRDFLMDKTRSMEYFVDPTVGQRIMAVGTLQLMKKELHFNMCKLETSYLYNSEVENLEEKIQEGISQALEYACCWWGYHINDAGDDKLQILYLVEEFFQDISLFWIEVLSILNKIRIIPTTSDNVIKWMQLWNLEVSKNKKYIHATVGLIKAKTQKYSENLQFPAICIEIKYWIQIFGRTFVEATPHIYLSGLPFLPQNSILRDLYGPKFGALAQICNGHQRNWPSLLSVLGGHTSSVTSVAFSPDGKHIVSGSYDKSLRIWNSETGEPKGKLLEGHTGYINSISLSPDGKKIVSGSDDSSLRIWNLETGKAEGKPIVGHTKAVTAVAFSSDGTKIVSGSHDKTIKIWNILESGEVHDGITLEGQINWLNTVSFSPDGKKIVAGSTNKSLTIWNAETGQVEGNAVEGHKKSIRAIAFSPDGKKIVSGSDDRSLRIWNVDTGAPQGNPMEGHMSSVTTVAFSPDGKKIISGSEDRLIRVWNAENGKLCGRPLEGHTDWVRSVAFSPDGNKIVSGSADRSLRIWNFANVEEFTGMEPNGHVDWINTVAFSPDGKKVVSGSDDKSLRIWNAETGEAERNLLEGHLAPVICAAFSPDGTKIVSGSSDKSVRIWNAKTGEAIGIPLKGHEGPVNSVAFSPNGRKIVSGADDKVIKIWDVETGKVDGNLEGHTDWIYSVSFILEGKEIISGSQKDSVIIWNAETRKTTEIPIEGYTNQWTNSVAFSPDGKRVVSALYNDISMKIRDVKTGETQGKPLEGHIGSIMAIAFSKDGKKIVSGSDDSSVRIWNAQTGEADGNPLEGHTDSILSVAFSPNGKQIVSGAADISVRIWNAETQVVNSLNQLESFLSFCPWHPSHYHAQAFPHFQHISRKNNGWLHGSDSSLFLWIPPEYQNVLMMPRMQVLISRGPPCSLDLSNFVHGDNWFKCYSK